MSNSFKTIVIVLVVFFQFFILLGMTKGRADILKNGTVISVRTMPIDPRDPLRGDYVILSYPFSNYQTIPENDASGISQNDRFQRGMYDFFQKNNGRFVYVTLVPEEESPPLPVLAETEKETMTWQQRQMETAMRPKIPGEKLWMAQKISFDKPTEGIFIRGRLRSYGQIDYGIEAYYVQEGTGKEIEKFIGGWGNSSGKQAIIDIAVTKNGETAIKDVRICESVLPAEEKSAEKSSEISTEE